MGRRIIPSHALACSECTESQNVSDGHVAAPSWPLLISFVSSIWQRDLEGEGIFPNPTRRGQAASLCWKLVGAVVDESASQQLQYHGDRNFP